MMYEMAKSAGAGGGFVIVLITCPQYAAQNVTSAILSKHLAACVNSIPNVYSTFWWKGKLTNDVESLLIVKTRKSMLKKLEAEVKKAHPYDVPEVLCIPILWGSKGYLKWVASETKGKRSR